MERGEDMRMSNSAAAPATVSGKRMCIKATGKLGRQHISKDPQARRHAIGWLSHVYASGWVTDGNRSLGTKEHSGIQ